MQNIFDLERITCNDHFLHLLRLTDAVKLKAHLIEQIETAGLNFTQRKFLEEVCHKAYAEGLDALFQGVS